MASIHRHALVKHSTVRMFGLVNDVASYPQRFAWCESSRVLEQSDTHMLARLDLRLAGFAVGFSTLNSLEPPNRISLKLQEGPFSEFKGEWFFHSLADDACKVSLTLEFEVASRLIASAMAVGFQGLADRMVDDFCREADLNDE